MYSCGTTQAAADAFCTYFGSGNCEEGTAVVTSDVLYKSQGCDPIAFRKYAFSPWLEQISATVSSDSTATVATSGSTGTTTPAGSVTLQDLGGGSFELSWLQLTGSDFSVAGQTLSDLYVILDGSVQFVVGSDGAFTIPAGSLTVDASAEFNGQLTGAVASTGEDATGTIDLANRTFTLSVSLVDSDDGITLDLSILATLTNLPPVARAAVAPTVECVSPQGAPVTLDASASSDPDGAADIASYTWLLLDSPGNAVLLGSGVTINPLLSIGAHQIMLVVADRSRASSTSTATVSVVDTVSPDNATAKQVGPCLLPGAQGCQNHVDQKLVLLQLGKELVVSAHDACDTNLTSFIKNVQICWPDEDGRSWLSERLRPSRGPLLPFHNRHLSGGCRHLCKGGRSLSTAV